jgi:hypothetical protein
MVLATTLFWVRGVANAGLDLESERSDFPSNRRPLLKQFGHAFGVLAVDVD